MANSTLGQEFQGLPMADLIGSPLNAACEANIKLAKATTDFITTVGFDQDGKIRNAQFSYNLNDGTKVNRVNIDVPVLSIVQIPSLKVDFVDITFDMEVKTSEQSKESKDASASLEAKAKGGWGPVSFSASVKGSVSTHKESTRSTDKSAKYHVQVKATDCGMPEGLARVLDMMNNSIGGNTTSDAPAIEKKDPKNKD